MWDVGTGTARGAITGVSLSDERQLLQRRRSSARPGGSRPAPPTGRCGSGTSALARGSAHRSRPDSDPHQEQSPSAVDGRTLATAGAGAPLVGRPPRTGGSGRRSRSADPRAYYTVAFSASGWGAVAAGGDRGWGCAALGPGKRPARTASSQLKPPTKRLYGVAFAPDGQTLASGDSNGTIRLWSVKTGAQLAHHTGDGQPALGLVHSPDGEMLADGSGSGVRLWDAHTASSLGTLSEPRGLTFVYGVAFSRDGKTLAAVSRPRRGHGFWNVSDPPPARAAQEAPRGPVQRVSRSRPTGGCSRPGAATATCGSGTRAPGRGLGRA